MNHYTTEINHIGLMKVLLTDYLGDEIFVRFKLYTDGGLRRDGFYFDNFKIKGLSENLNISEIEQYGSKLPQSCQ